MVNIRTSKKRKSNYNRTRSRLSRRVKRGGGGGWFDIFGLSGSAKPAEDTTTTTKVDGLSRLPVTTEDEYLTELNKIQTTYKYIKDIHINTRTIPDDTTLIDSDILTQPTNALKATLDKLFAYQQTRIEAYRELFLTSVPEYPYARNLTAEDIRKAEEIRASRSREPVYVSDSDGHGLVLDPRQAN
jgi:hypothetical protein